MRNVKQMMLYLYNIYNILRIVSNKLHDRIFDILFLEKQVNWEEEIKTSSYDIFIKVINVKEFLDLLKTISREEVIKCEFSMLSPVRNSLVHYQRFLGSFYGLYMEGLERERTLVMITDTLFNFKFSIPLREFLVPEDLGYLYLLKLILKKCYVIHGGFAELQGRRILFVGLPGAGKTTLALDLLAKGAHVFSDDMTIVASDGIAYGLPPRRMGLRTFAEKDVRKLFLSFRLLRELLSKISYLRWLPYISLDFTNLLSISTERLNQAFPGKIMKGYGKPDYIILINYSNSIDRVIEVPHDALAEKILYISMREWYYMDTNPLLLKYAYINENFPLKAILDKRIEIIKGFIRNSKATTVEITTDNPRKLREKVLNLTDIKTSYEN